MGVDGATPPLPDELVRAAGGDQRLPGSWKSSSWNLCPPSAVQTGPISILREDWGGATFSVRLVVAASPMRHGYTFVVLVEKQHHHDRIYGGSVEVPHRARARNHTFHCSC